MLREKPEDAQTLEFCQRLKTELDGVSAFSAPLRVQLDSKIGRGGNKRWDWVRRGAPVILEVGPRDVGNDVVTLIRRDRLYENEKVVARATPRAEFVANVAALLAEIQASLFAEAKERLQANIRKLTNWAAVVDYFGKGGDDEDREFKGWVRAPWARPTGAELEEVDARLKAFKLTLRNIPLAQEPASGPCIFTGRPAVEDILIARAY